jgi:hypothetical protein
MDNIVPVYMRVELADGTELISDVFWINKSEYNDYWIGKLQDSELWPEEWLEFEDDIVESVLELANQEETA